VRYFLVGDTSIYDTLSGRTFWPDRLFSLLGEAAIVGSDAVPISNATLNDSGSIYTPNTTVAAGDVDRSGDVVRSLKGYTNLVAEDLTTWGTQSSGGTVGVSDIGDGVYRVTINQVAGQTAALVKRNTTHELLAGMSVNSQIRLVSGDASALELYAEQTASPYTTAGYEYLGEITTDWQDLEMKATAGDWTNTLVFFYSSEVSVTFDIRMMRAVESAIKHGTAVPGSAAGATVDADSLSATPASTPSGSIYMRVRPYGYPLDETSGWEGGAAPFDPRILTWGGYQAILRENSLRFVTPCTNTTMGEPPIQFGESRGYMFTWGEDTYSLFSTESSAENVACVAPAPSGTLSIFSTDQNRTLHGDGIPGVIWDYELSRAQFDLIDNHYASILDAVEPRY
jgi:hypothetical protein